MERSINNFPRESAILARRDYNKVSPQTIIMQKNEILFKVIEMAENVKQFDDVYSKQFHHIYNFVGNLHDHNVAQNSSDETIKTDESQNDRPQISSNGQITTLAEIVLPQLDSAERLHLNAKNIVLDAEIISADAYQPNIEEIADDLASSTDEVVCTAKTIAVIGKHEATKYNADDQSNNLNGICCYTPLRNGKSQRAKLPILMVGRRQSPIIAKSNQSNSISAAIALIVAIVIAFLIAFVAYEAFGCTTIETVSKFAIDFMVKFKELMLRSLVEQSQKKL